MALIEAMSLGVPCVATRVGSVAELIVDERNGYLLTPGDVDGLIRRLELLLRNPDEWARVSAEAKATWHREYTGDVMYSALSRLWRSEAGVARF